MWRWRWALGRLLPLLVASAVASTLVAACADGDRGAPTTLMDGSRAATAPVDFEGVDEPAVLTSVAVHRAHQIESGSAVGRCLHAEWSEWPVGPIVVRVGVLGESVTFRDRARRGLYGCDNSEGPREEDRRWCGRSFGELSGGQLRDPRLDMGPCTTSDGTLTGFAWIEPGPDASYVVVRQRGYAEVYETAGDLPLRVMTNDVDAPSSSASFDVSEHGSTGRLIREYRLEASVAG